MLIITGTPRSGTTLLAAYCKMMGNDPGGEYLREVNAGLEEPLAVAAIEAFEHKQIEAAKEMIRGIHRPVIKDPQFLSRGRPDFLEVWAGARRDLQLLILTRDYNAIGESMAQNQHEFNEWGTPRMTVIKYRHLTNMFMEAVHYLKLPYQTLSFPELLVQFNKVWTLLTEFGDLKLQVRPDAMPEFGLTYERDTAESVWNRWMDRTKVRH